MAKPWAKLEIGYLDHPKFLALNGNAISLWHEAKNYCDKYHTDGLIPKEALKIFRFSGKKTVELLTKSCGKKPDGVTDFSPLWEPHPVGYKMHDYLDHNDCRDEVMARIDAAEDAKTLRKVGNRERQAKLRAERKARIAALQGTGDGHADVTDVTRDVTRDVTPLSRTPTETATTTETREREDASRPARPMAPIHDRSHHKHAHCGRVCLPAPLFGEFVRRRNHPNADHEIREWALREVERDWAEGGKFGTVEPGDAWEFWKARYAEKWPAVSTAPVAGPKTVSAKDHPYAAFHRPTVAEAR